MKTLWVKDETHRKVKTRAAELGVSMVDFLDSLL